MLQSSNENEEYNQENSAIGNEPFYEGCKPFSEWPEVMTHGDIISCLGISHKHAWDLLKSDKLQRPFPNDKRGMLTGKYALRDFINGRIIAEGKL